MTVYWLKLLHLAALAIWAGGVLVLPVLLGQRAAAGQGAALHRLHALTRFAYISITSPAAFLAIASGTALILLRQTYDAWFALKLLLVGVLVALHVWIGLLVLAVFRRDGGFARWRVVASLVVLSAVMLGIFWVVLAKPALPIGELPEALSRPGALREVVRPWLPAPLQSWSDTMMPTP